MKALLKGKVIQTDFYQGNYYSIVAEAAQDLYSQPSSFRVKSEQQLPLDQEVTLSVNISGYCKMKQYKDKNTGEIKHYPESNFYLDARIAQPQDVKQPMKQAS